MSVLKKVLICPYFGPFPEWMDLFLADFNRTMKSQGYDLFIFTDLPEFKERVKAKLGIDYPGVRGTGKPWDYRGSLGVLYSEEIKRYDFFGHCDLDVVWGNVNKFVPDSLLNELDVYSSHNEYVCGAFSLYRSTPKVYRLFYDCPTWKQNLMNSEPTGWIEHDYSRTLETSGLRYKYDFPQGYPWTKTPELKKEKDGSLFQFIKGEWTEVALFHFRHSKKWPL